MTNICAHPDCNKKADFPAPKNPRDIGARQYFCQQHIAEFNKKWNGLDGFTEDDIYAMQNSATWDRPTWKFGTQSDSAKASTFEFARAEDLFSFFRNRQMKEAAKGKKSSYSANNDLPPDVNEACIIFSVQPPYTAPQLKKRYLSLMKKHHPDVNNGSAKAEEMVKKINVSHQILMDYIA